VIEKDSQRVARRGIAHRVMQFLQRRDACGRQ
jgi:hypothetical protein